MALSMHLSPVFLLPGYTINSVVVNAVAVAQKTKKKQKLSWCRSGRGPTLLSQYSTQETAQSEIMDSAVKAAEIRVMTFTQMLIEFPRH